MIDRITIPMLIIALLVTYRRQLIAVLVVAAMIGGHVAMLRYSDRKHASATATIRAADELLMAECRDIVERTNSEPYDTVRDYTREIDRKQGVVMPWTVKEEMQAENQQGRK